MNIQTHLLQRKVNSLPRLKTMGKLVSNSKKSKLLSHKGFGLNEVIGIAAGIIIAVVVVIPGLQGFAGDILDNLTSWWNDMASSVFATP